MLGQLRRESMMEALELLRPHLSMGECYLEKGRDLRWCSQLLYTSPSLPRDARGYPYHNPPLGNTSCEQSSEEITDPQLPKYPTLLKQTPTFSLRPCRLSQRMIDQPTRPGQPPSTCPFFSPSSPGHQPGWRACRVARIGA